MDHRNEEDLRQLVDICRGIEAEIRNIDRDGILSALDAVAAGVAKSAHRELLGHLVRLRDFVELLTRLQLDFRIVRLRVESSLPPEEELPDSQKTPRRPVSVQDLQALKAGRPRDPEGGN